MLCLLERCQKAGWDVDAECEGLLVLPLDNKGLGRGGIGGEGLEILGCNLLALLEFLADNLINPDICTNINSVFPSRLLIKKDLI